MTPLWTGIKPFFTQGNVRAFGMPAFYHLFKNILNDDRLGKMYIILLGGENVDIVLPEIYKDKIEIFPIFGFHGKLRTLINVTKAFFLGLKVIKTRKVDMIFGHGPHSFIAGFWSVLKRIPNVRRLYGVYYLSNTKNLNSWKALFNHPFLFFHFKLPAKAFIITNDGTHGNKFFEKLGNKKNRFIFEINGVDHIDKTNFEIPDIQLPKKFITYIGRISRFKRQLLLIEALGILKSKGIEIPLLIIGQVSEEDYFKNIQELIEKYQLKDLITFTGGLPLNQAMYLMSISYLTLSVYIVSNLGNVFLEAMRVGVPMVAINVNNSLDFFPKNTYFPVEGESAHALAQSIQSVWNQPDLRKETGENAYAFAETQLKTWDQRNSIDLEILLTDEYK